MFSAFTPWQVSLCNEPLKEVSNPGASGALFFLTPDDNFILKTVQKKEANFLRKLLPGYFLVCSPLDVQAGAGTSVDVVR